MISVQWSCPLSPFCVSKDRKAVQSVLRGDPWIDRRISEQSIASLDILITLTLGKLYSYYSYNYIARLPFRRRIQTQPRYMICKTALLCSETENASETVFQTPKPVHANAPYMAIYLYTWLAFSISCQYNNKDQVTRIGKTAFPDSDARISFCFVYSPLYFQTLATLGRSPI